MKKTLPAVSESTRFSAILRGIRKAKARADEGSDRCCVVVVVVVVVVAAAAAAAVVAVHVVCLFLGCCFEFEIPKCFGQFQGNKRVAVSMFFVFISIWGSFLFDEYFPDGLKPPTRNYPQVSN